MFSAIVRNLTTESQRRGDGQERKLIRSMKALSVIWRSYRAKKTVPLSLCMCALALMSVSCGSKPIDPRTVIPADSLVYLETSDLGKALAAITSNPKLRQFATTMPDTTALNGIRLSVAVTGFQTSEEAISEENSVLNFIPRFVAVAETNAWNFQALSFTENQIGEFINDAYGGEVNLLTEDKYGGKYFTWTAVDGRKAFALVLGSLILFGNDEAGIEACINTMNGGGERIAANPKVSAFSRDSLAAGFVSKEGVAQLANIAGVSFAIDSGDEAEVRNFVAQVMPQIVRNSVSEATWTARRLEDGRIEDKYEFSLAPDTAGVLAETIVTGPGVDQALRRSAPAEAHSATTYDLKDAQIAWRSVLFMARTKVDAPFGNLISALSPAVFESYGIADGELFLSSVENGLQTVRFDSDGEEVAVIAKIKDLEDLKRSLARDLKASEPPAQTGGFEAFRTEDTSIAAAIIENIIVIGDATTVDKCVAAFKSGQESTPSSVNDKPAGPGAPIITIGRDAETGPALMRTLKGGMDAPTIVQDHVTETRFNQNGIVRRTVSDFGFIGAIIRRLDPER